jgi:hypothetical protein
LEGRLKEIEELPEAGLALSSWQEPEKLIEQLSCYSSVEKARFDNHSVGESPKNRSVIRSGRAVEIAVRYERTVFELVENSQNCELRKFWRARSFLEVNATAVTDCKGTLAQQNPRENIRTPVESISNMVRIST